MSIRLAAIALLLWSSTGFASGTTHRFAAVDKVQANSSHSDCFYFTLKDINQADPAVPGAGPWFAVPRTQFGAKDAYAALLAAKISGSLVWIATTGDYACGYAGIHYVVLE